MVAPKEKGIDSSTASVLSELKNISSLKDEQSMALYLLTMENMFPLTFLSGFKQLGGRTFTQPLDLTIQRYLWLNQNRASLFYIMLYNVILENTDFGM